MNIEDLTRLQTQVRNLIAMKKRVEKLSGKSYSDMSMKQVQKNGADLTWLGMDIDKATHEAHAAAVDCGIADPRPDDAYGPVFYHPSSLHKYKHIPTKPKCRQ